MKILCKKFNPTHVDSSFFSISFQRVFRLLKIKIIFSKMDRKFTKNIITRGKVPFNTIARSSKSFLPNCQTFARTPLEILHTHTHTHTGARVTKQHPSPPWPPQITNHQSHARSINHWPNTWRTRSVNYQPGRSASQSAPSNHRN